MARGKAPTLEEKIQKVQDKITDLNEKLANAEAELKELESQKKERDLAELQAIITSSGKSIAEVKQMLLRN